MNEFRRSDCLDKSGPGIHREHVNRDQDDGEQVNPEQVNPEQGVGRNERVSASDRSASTGPTWWRELALLSVLYAGYEIARGLDADDFATALRNGRDLLHLEQVWHLSPEPLLNNFLAHQMMLAVVAAYFYATLHYLVTPTVLIWMYRVHPGHYRRARTTLAAGTIIGLVGFYLVPTAPPRLLPRAGFQDTLEDVHEWGWWGGDGSVPRGLGSVANQLAAMPSLHVGWALWCGVLLFRYSSRRSVRWLGLIYPVATTIVVISTGNHYLIDALAGAATMGAGLVVARHLKRPRNHRPTAGTSG